MAEFTNVTIDGTKTSLLFGAWFDFDLRDGRRISHVKVISRAANGDLEIAGTDDGPISRLRPSKIVGVVGAGGDGIDALPPLAGSDHPVSKHRATSAGDGYVCEVPVRAYAGGPVLACGRVVEKRDGVWRHYVETRKLSIVQATDEAIAEENARALADPAIVAGDQMQGDLYRLRLERDGVLPPLDPDLEPESRDQAIRDLEAGIATPDDFALPTTPTAFVDQVRSILSAPSRGRYASGREAVAKVLRPTSREARIVRAVPERKPEEPADAYLRRIEPTKAYGAFLETDAGQELLREAADDSRAARNGRSASRTDGAHRKPRGADIEIPDGAKRCSGVPKREIEPHIEPVASFGKKATARDGLASTCKVCHKIFAEIGRAKRAAAKGSAASDV